MITTKNLSRAAFVLLAGTLAPAALEAADTITIPAPTTADWYAQRSNANVSAPTVGDDGTVTFSKMDYGAYAWAYFTPVKLEVGQWISFSGTAIFNSMYAGTESKDPGKFLFGLFDSNTNSQASLNSALGISGTSDADASKHGINADGKSATLGMKVLTGDMTGFFCDSSSSSAYAWLATHSNYGFLATNGSKTTQTSQTLSPTLAVPAALTEYDFSFNFCDCDFFGGGFRFSVRRHRRQKPCRFRNHGRDPIRHVHVRESFRHDDGNGDSGAFGVRADHGRVRAGFGGNASPRPASLISCLYASGAPVRAAAGPKV